MEAISACHQSGMPPFMQPFLQNDDYIMYEYKCRLCPRTRGHDWALCPQSHPNEKTRRRSPREFNYSSVVCPNMKEFDGCPRGDACTMSHSVYEVWLHPSRYHTELCRMGSRCNRRICFFAHSAQELRVPQLQAPEPKPIITQAISSSHDAPAATATADTADAAASKVSEAAADADQEGLHSSCKAVILQAPILKVSAGALSCSLQDGTCSTVSDLTPHAASGPDVFPSASAAPDSSTSTPTALSQAQIGAVWPANSNAVGAQKSPLLNRAARRQHLQWQEGKPPVSPATPSFLQGLLANLGVGGPPGSLGGAPGSLSNLAHLQAQMSGMGVSAATAALYGPPANSTSSAMLLNGINSALASQAMVMQPSGLFQLAQQSMQPPSFVSQDSMFSRSQGIPAGNRFLLPPQGGFPVSFGVGGGGEYGLAPAEHFPPGIMYHQVPVAGAGAFGAVGSRLQAMPMQQPMQQMMLVPAQMGAHDFGGAALPPPASSSAMGQQGSLFGFF